MKKHYKLVLIVLVFLLITMITTGVGVSYAYYRTSVTGAVSNKTSDYACDIQVVSETHTIVPASNTAAGPESSASDCLISTWLSPQLCAISCG